MSSRSATSGTMTTAPETTFGIGMSANRIVPRRTDKSATAPSCHHGRPQRSPLACVRPWQQRSEVSVRRIILAAILMGFTVGAHAANDTDKKPAGAGKGAAAGAVAGHEV